MTDDQIKHMVNRFLNWRLPESFSPDGGISFKKTYNDHMPFGPQKHEPSGTNLFDYTQAEAMVRYMIDGMPSHAVEREWQDISTAPKMKDILLFAVTDIGENGEVKNWKMATGFWHSGFADHRDMSPWQWNGRQLAKYDIQPTHWKPLPAPPHRAGDDSKT